MECHRKGTIKVAHIVKLRQIGPYNGSLLHTKIFKSLQLELIIRQAERVTFLLDDQATNKLHIGA